MADDKIAKTVLVGAKQRKEGKIDDYLAQQGTLVIECSDYPSIVYAAAQAKGNVILAAHGRDDGTFECKEN